MDIVKLLKVCIIFLIGFLSANLLSFYLVYGLEMPFLMNFGVSYNDAPFDFIKQDQIQIYEDKIVINVEGASMSRYAPTGSMKPVLDEGANGIRVKPKSEDNIHVGDIITFKQGSHLIVHRVVDKGIDQEGIYFVTKGDNNSVVDGKIRFLDIEYITVAMIW